MHMHGLYTRRFLHETVHLRNTQDRNTLLSKLSPAMQGEVSLLVNQRWVNKIWYLQRGVQLELLMEIAARLTAQVFAPWEFVPCGAMYIANRGTGAVIRIDAHTHAHARAAHTHVHTRTRAHTHTRTHAHTLMHESIHTYSALGRPPSLSYLGGGVGR